MGGPVAVVGAAGFIGNRIVEVLHRAGERVVAIARTPSRLALACRFDIPVRVADALDEGALSHAFEGCETGVIAVAGDPATIVGVIEPVYRAAERAQLRRLVYLSTASVHGQAPQPGTDETSELSVHQELAYNNAKVRAEQQLARLRANGRTEVVTLRPGIVYGPRSYWTGGLADELLAGEAYLVDGGHGVCNAIYVDNVVHAVRLALSRPGVDGEAFLIADRELVTWRDLYRPVSEALGVSLESVPTPPASAARAERQRSDRLRRPPPAVTRLVPRPVRAGLRAAYRTARPARPAEVEPGPVVALERAMLHTCAVKLPWTKARTQLAYEPLVSFEEGCRLSVEWLAFAGYPVEQGALR